MQVFLLKIFNFAAFQFMLGREFARAGRLGGNLSLITFCIQPESTNFLPKEALILLLSGITKIKREIDVFGHVGEKSFGVLLSETDCNQAREFINRIQLELPKIVPELAQYKPKLYFGLASAPQHTQAVNQLAQMAQQAMSKATEENLPVIVGR